MTRVVSGVDFEDVAPHSNSGLMKKQGNHKSHHGRDALMGGTDLWSDGLLCAFEYVRVPRRRTAHSKSGRGSRFQSFPNVAVASSNKQAFKTEQTNSVSTNVFSNSSLCETSPPAEPAAACETELCCDSCEKDGFPGSYWMPIGWTRISELVQTVQIDAHRATFPIELPAGEDDLTVADVAAPYWERPVGPTWWCHVDAGHPHISAWLSNAQWLHPAISTALRDESKLISERMKHLFYEVPVKVGGGLLFELLGQSAGDPNADENDIPIVLRSWLSQNFLITSMHVKGSSTNINVLGIVEVQELLAAGGINIPRSIHEVVAHLVSRLARWDDRLFRKSIFGVADELELKFMDRRTHEDMHLFSIILNQEIRRLSTQVIRVKWSLHAREEIVFELLQQLRGNVTRCLLEGVRNSTREMIEEQEAVRGRLFTIQDVMQSTVRAWLQDRSLTVTHNLGVLGGCGLILSIITGLFGINVDGIPGAEKSPYAFLLFSGLLVLLGVVLIGIGLLYLGLKNPIVEEDVAVRKLELQELVRMFQREAESHAQVRKNVPQSTERPATAGIFSDPAGYVLIS